MSVEETRGRFRPPCILTLFVGESAPIGGTFFYCGNSLMAHYMKQAVEEALGVSDNFLERFKSYGWFLDDLMLRPVNHLGMAQRRQEWLNAQPSLARRIAEYKPRAIVTLLRGMRHIVQGAARAAGSSAEHHLVPFPGMGHQARFRKEMATIIPKPRAPIRMTTKFVDSR
jgi:hypothetical protein